MAKPKTKKDITAFKAGLIPLLKSSNVELPETEMDKLLENLMIYFSNKYRPDEKTPHWNALVSQYFQTYQEVVGERPAFLSSEPKGLKQISQILMDRYMKKNPQGIWDEETALKQHQIFYQAILTLHNAKQYFSISYLHLNFDKLCSQLAYKNKYQ